MANDDLRKFFVSKRNIAHFWIIDGIFFFFFNEFNIFSVDKFSFDSSRTSHPFSRDLFSRVSNFQPRAYFHIYTNPLFGNEVESKPPSQILRCEALSFSRFEGSQFFPRLFQNFSNERIIYRHDKK